MEKGPSETVILGGRTYRHIGVGPLCQELFVMKHCRHAGLVGCGMLEGETPEDYAARLLDMILQSGRALLLLGGLLVPEGTRSEDWSEDMAYETAGALGRIMDAEEKKAVYQQMLSMVLGFFVNGLGSWIASGRASAGGNGTETASPTANAGENGTGSSAPSPATTPTEPAASPAG